MKSQNKNNLPANSNGQNKTVTYKFVTGKTSVAEVSDEIAAFLAEADREEHAQEVAARRHTYSLDAILYEGSEFSNGKTPETDLVSTIDRERFRATLSILTDRQRRRLKMFSEGLSSREIATREGIADHKAILESINTARRKIQKLF